MESLHSERDTMPISLLRLPAVMERVGYRRSSIYRLIESGDFPQPIRLGPLAIAWPSDEIDRWITNRIEESRREAAK